MWRVYNDNDRQGTNLDQIRKAHLKLTLRWANKRISVKRITFRIFNTAFCQKKIMIISTVSFTFFFQNHQIFLCANMIYLTCIDDFHSVILTRNFIAFISPSTAVWSTVSFLVPTQLIFRVHWNTFSVTIHTICNKRPIRFILKK